MSSEFNNRIYKYPFETLPELGLLRRSDYPLEDFESHATTLTPEDERVFQSAYVWLQTHLPGDVPISLRGSYSEMWYILEKIKFLMGLSNACHLGGFYHGPAVKHIHRYKRATMDNSEYYYDFNDLRVFDFGKLGELLKNCSLFELDLALGSNFHAS